MKGVYHLLGLVKDNKIKYDLFNIIKTDSIQKLDELTVNYPNFKSINKNIEDLTIVSDNNLIDYYQRNYEPWREQVLYLDDKKFYDIYSSNDISMRNKYTELLKNAYINYTKHNIPEIKKHPIIHMIKKTNFLDNINSNNLKEQDLIFLVNRFYNNYSYKKIRDLYLILKNNNILPKELMYSTDNENIINNNYYLYLKDERLLPDKNNILKDKIKLIEGTLEDIDKFTIKYNNTQEIGSNSQNNLEQIILFGEGFIISGTTKNIIERKLNKTPIYYDILTSNDKEFYDNMHSTNSLKKDYFDKLRGEYIIYLYDDSECLNNFIHYYKHQLKQNFENGIDYKEIILLLNEKTKNVNYRMARYMYMEIKKSRERERIKRYERNRRIH